MVFHILMRRLSPNRIRMRLPRVYYDDRNAIASNPIGIDRHNYDQEKQKEG
jgi:hypothetical protein